MSYEVKQQVVAPIRNAFTYLIERNGDRPATRYEEATIDLQPTENFHYRPLWDPAHEIYDVDYSALKLSDPYSFLDPRQYYYFPYVVNRAGLLESFGASLSYLESRGLLAALDSSWSEVMSHEILPLRHYEAGAQLITQLGSRFAYGTSIEQAASFSAFDRMGLAQMISRVGISLESGSSEILGEAKHAWISSPNLQGLRRMVEELLIEGDWAIALMGLDQIDRIIYPLVWMHLDDVAVKSGAGAFSLIAQHFATWYKDQRKWLDALIRAWVADPVYGLANTAILSEAVTTSSRRAERAVAEFAEAFRPLDANCPATVAELASAARSALSALGIEGK